MGDETLTVLLVSSVAGRFGGNLGDTRTLPIALARAWIAAGVAMLPPDDVPEAAVVSAPETAMRPRARGRG